MSRARAAEDSILAVCGNGPIESPEEVALVMAWARLGAEVVAALRLDALERREAGFLEYPSKPGRIHGAALRAAQSLGLLGEEAQP